MKQFIFSLMLIFAFLTCKSQTKLVELKTFNARKILANLNKFKTYSLPNFLLKIYEFDNESGSAKLTESDEVSSGVLIVKTAYGESEIAKFYIIKGLINSKIVSVKETEIILQQQNNKILKKYQF